MFQFSSLLARTEAEREPRRSKHAAPPADSTAVEIHPNASLVTDELSSTSNACVSERVRRDLDEQMRRLADLLDRVESLDVERDNTIDEVLAAVEASAGGPAAHNAIDDRPLAVPHELQPNRVDEPRPGPADIDPPVLTITPLASAADESSANEPKPCCEVILGNGNASSLADLPSLSTKDVASDPPRAKPGFTPRRPFQPATKIIAPAPRAHDVLCAGSSFNPEPKATEPSAEQIAVAFGSGLNESDSQSASHAPAPVAGAPATTGLVQQFPAIGVATPSTERGKSHSGRATRPQLDADLSPQSLDPVGVAEFPSRDVWNGDSIVQTVLPEHFAGPSAIGSAATPVVLVEDGPAICFKSGEPAPPPHDLTAGCLGDSAFSSQNVWDGRSTVETLFQPLPCTARSLGSPATAVVLVEDPLAENPNAQIDILRAVDIPANLRSNPSFPSRQVWDCGRSTVETLFQPLPCTARSLGSPATAVMLVEDPLAENPNAQVDNLRAVDIPANLRSNSSFPSRQVWDCGSTVETLCPLLPRTANAVSSPNPSVVVVDDMPSECKQHVDVADSSYFNSWRHAPTTPILARQLPSGRSVVQTVFSAVPTDLAQPVHAAPKIEACADDAAALKPRSEVRHGSSLAVLKEPTVCKTEGCARPTSMNPAPRTSDCGTDRKEQAAVSMPVEPVPSVGPPQAPPRRPMRAMRLGEVEPTAAATAVDAGASTMLNVLAALGGLLTLAALVYVAADLASWL
jgi:hypothetical protein